MESILTHLQQSFAAWQASSSTKRQSNATLRAQAVKCLEHYSYNEVSAAIGMSVNTLRSWQKSHHHDQEITALPPTFVPMNLDEAQHLDTANEAPLSLQVSLSSGVTIQVTAPNLKSAAAFILTLNQGEIA